LNGDCSLVRHSNCPTTDCRIVERVHLSDSSLVRKQVIGQVNVGSRLEITASFVIRGSLVTSHENYYDSRLGIDVGSTIGLYLDLDKCLLSFYCNDEKHGPIEFPSLEDVDIVYPAFSMNRNVTMTLYSGLKPPSQA